MNAFSIFPMMLVVFVTALGIAAVFGVLYTMFILGQSPENKSLNDRMGDRVDAAANKKAVKSDTATQRQPVAPSPRAANEDLADLRAAQADAVAFDPAQVAALAREQRTESRIEPTLSGPLPVVTPQVATVSEVSEILARAQLRTNEAVDTQSVPVLVSAPEVPAPARQAAAMEKEENTLAEKRDQAVDRDVPEHLLALMDREMPQGFTDVSDSFSPTFNRD